MPAPARRARLSIDVSGEARRRIRVAAASRDQSIREYVWAALEHRLKRDLRNDPVEKDLIGLTDAADPVLGTLWRNPKDAAYDDL